MVYQCHCLVTGRRMRESMDAYTPPGQTTWTLGRGGERVGVGVMGEVAVIR